MNEQALTSYDNKSTLVTRLDQLSTQSDDSELQTCYYPKTFICQPGMNPLLSATTPALSLLSRIRQLNHYAKVDELFDNLVNEIEASCYLARTYRYQRKNCIIVKYLLAATFDQVIGDTTWGKELWSTNKLRNHFFKNRQSHQQIFEIIRQLLLEGKEHVDLLELTYICLSLGYKPDLDDNIHLGQFQQQLYRITQDHRRNEIPLQTKQFKQSHPSVKTASLMLILSAFLAGSSYLSLHLFHKSNVSMLEQQIQDIQNINKA